jgi:beta-alanine degradation protein BauB
MTASLRAQDLAGQKVVFENELVRVLDIRVPAGVFEPEHSHARGVTIAMSDYDNQTKSQPDGKIGGGHTRFGEVRWAEPVTHEARNTGTVEQHVIRIELKKHAPATAPDPGPMDALIVCKDTEKLLFENAYVRAIEDKGGPGHVAGKHSHWRGLVISMSDYDSQTTTWPGEKVSTSHSAMGDIRWSDAVLHEVRNLGANGNYAIRVEIK